MDDQSSSLIHLEQKRAEIEAQIVTVRRQLDEVKALAAAKAKQTLRKQLSRRRYLAGEVALAAVEAGTLPADFFRNALDVRLTSDADRQLFQLPPLSTTAKLS